MGLELRRPERAYTIRQLCVEFKVTPRALRFYEDKGLLSPARDGMNRVYHNRDRARLQLILRGKRVGFSLSEIREILELYDEKDGGAAQMARSLKKFRERIVALHAQRDDIDGAIQALEDGCVRLEKQLSDIRPDLLPQAADYESALTGRLVGVPGHAAE
jgi:DNA-binding transcriptional MerR regulator